MSGLGPQPGPFGLESRLYRRSQIPSTQKRICNLHSVFLPYGVRLSASMPCIGRSSMQAGEPFDNVIYFNACGICSYCISDTKWNVYLLHFLLKEGWKKEQICTYINR